MDPEERGVAKEVTKYLDWMNHQLDDIKNELKLANSYLKVLSKK